MPPRRDCQGRIPESSQGRIFEQDHCESSPWTPGSLGMNDWADPTPRHLDSGKPLYAQAGSGNLPLGASKQRPVTSLLAGAIDFLILELGPDQKDSIAFKKAMESHKLGSDLTPKLAGLKRATQKQGVTYLSTLREQDFVTPQLKQWLQKVAACKPVILYISGHHSDSKPIFYNDNDCGLLIDKGSIRVGKYVQIVFMDIFTGSGRKTIKVPIAGFSKNLVAIIADACNLLSSGVAITGAASSLQSELSNKHGKPLVLGFRDKAPPAGTGRLHRSFVSSLAKKLKRGSTTHQDVIDCWVQAGQRWANKKYSKKLGVLGADGKFRGYDGKLVK